MLEASKRLRQTKNILVVDDTKSMRDHLCALLIAHNYQAFSTSDGKEALTYLLSHPDVDLVISDIVMPKMDGIALLTEIRKHHAIKALPVILVSGQFDEATELKAMSLGATRVFKKPFNATTLVAEITSQLATAGGIECLSNKTSQH